MTNVCNTCFCPIYSTLADIVHDFTGVNLPCSILVQVYHCKHKHQGSLCIVHSCSLQIACCVDYRDGRLALSNGYGLGNNISQSQK